MALGTALELPSALLRRPLAAAVLRLQELPRARRRPLPLLALVADDMRESSVLRAGADLA